MTQSGHPSRGPECPLLRIGHENCDDLGRKIGRPLNQFSAERFCESFGVDSFLEAPPYEVLVFASLVATSSKIESALTVEGVHGNESHT